MILIQEILISEEIITEHFACRLDKCKGACCVEGDYGAPLNADEIDIMEGMLSIVRPYLTEASIDKIEKEGSSVYNEESKTHETPLMEDGACVFMGRDSIGITYCSIEKAYYDGKTDWKKPISCHLYPIRVSENEGTGFQAINYDRWDICKSACSAGKAEKIKIYEFVRDGLIRKYGESFYEELEAAADHINEE